VDSVLVPSPSAAQFWSCHSHSYACSHHPASNWFLVPVANAGRSCPSSDHLNGYRKPKRHETMCAQWQAARLLAQQAAPGGHSSRAQLDSTASALPQGGFAPATPASAPAPSPASTQWGSFFPWQRPAAPPLGAPRRLEADLRRRKKLSIVVPDQPSFGSMSTRTSTIFPARGITATRSKARICAEQTPKLPATAQRKTSTIHKVGQSQWATPP
jgi:hypothetical protein